MTRTVSDILLYPQTLARNIYLIKILVPIVLNTTQLTLSHDAIFN